MKAKLNKKQQLIAYILKTDDDMGNPSAKAIGGMFGVSATTIHNAVKTVRYEKQIYDLKSELDETKKRLLKLNPAPERNGIITVDIDMTDY